MFLGHFCLVHDDLFHFLCQHATEITARIRLQDEIKVVTRGGLWYEEALPAETILFGIMVITPMKSGTFTDQEKISAALKYKINYDECYHLFLTRVLRKLGPRSSTPMTIS